MAISVVVPSRNRAASLAPVLRAALHDDACGELVVVLDGCTDASSAVVEELAASDGRVRCVDLPANVGPHGARLEGVRQARGPHVLCLDDDVIVGAGTVEGHALRLGRGDADVVVGYMPVSARVPRRDPVIQMYAGTYESHAHQWSQDGGSILGTLWGGCISLGRDDYLSAAERCEPTLRYFEDKELGFALRSMRRTAVFDRNLAAEHLYQRSVEDLCRDMERAGEAYAVLGRRWPEYAEPWHTTFAPELRNRPRRALVRAAGNGVASARLAAAVRGARRTGIPGAIPEAFLRVLSRAHLLKGFLASSLCPPDARQALIS